MIELNNIYKRYHTKNESVEVIREMSLKIQKGEFIALHGPSGSGKTTLLNIIGLIDDISEGTYLLDGVDVSSMRSNQLSAIRNEQFGYIFQRFYLIPELNILDNICVPLGYAKIGKKERELRAKELLLQVGMEEYERKYPNELSGGEQQRIAIIRAMMNEPKVILADEPTGNLDEANAKNVMDMLVDLHQKGYTIVMVSHDPSIIAYATRRIELRK